MEVLLTELTAMIFFVLVAGSVNSAVTTQTPHPPSKHDLLVAVKCATSLKN